MIKRSFELARNDAIEALADELEAVNLNSHRDSIEGSGQRHASVASADCPCA
jgi:hypothetical protein